MATEDLGMLMKDTIFQGYGRDWIPNRSESAPPSIEGSFAAFESLMSQQNFSLSVTLADLKSTIGSHESEQFRADPAYLGYYSSNVNLNPRLPPPLVSFENRRLFRHIGSHNDRRLLSFDDPGNLSLHVSESNLPTHAEEYEEDKSPKRTCDDWADRSSEFSSEQNASSPCQHKVLVDELQEDYKHSSSPLYNKSCSISHDSVDEAVKEGNSSSSLDFSVSTSNVIVSSPGTDDTVLSLNSDMQTATISSSSSLDGTRGVPASPYRTNLNVSDAYLKDVAIRNGVPELDVAHIESGMAAIGLSSLQNTGNHQNQRDQQHGDSQNNKVQQAVGLHQSHTFGVQVSNSHIIPQGMSHTHVGMNQFSQGPFNFPSAEVQSVQTPGFTPPLYANAAAYMNLSNPYYPNLHPSAYFSQFGVGGYSLNTVALPPFVAGFPHGAVPVSVDGSAGFNFRAQTSGVLIGGSTSHAVDMHHLNKYYGQPPITNPLNMHYFQQSSGDAYKFPGQYNHLTSRDCIVGNQVGDLDSQRGKFAACSTDQKLHYNGIGGLDRDNITHYFRNPTNAGSAVQLSTSHNNPILPGSLSAATSFPGGKSELNFQPESSKNVGLHYGQMGQRVLESPLDTKCHSFLEELRSGRGRRFELVDIAGHIVEFSSDQHGSRFIQQKLENCSIKEKASVFKEVLPHASKLMTDVFGNYVIQKFFEYGSPELRKELASKLEGQIVPLSFQMYGCRVIQKALEVIELDQKIKLVHELDGHVLRCVRDQNGNHVIQKCIESIPTDKIGFIISAFRGQIATLSTHPYGCRVIQRVLEHCTDEVQSQFIVDEILESAYALSQDQYGNYVTQHVLHRGSPCDRSQIIKNLSGHIVQMSQHKYASNVVEKCLEHGDFTEREILIGEVIGNHGGNDNLLTMMKDQYANYVVQKIIETCTESQREELLGRISIHLNALKKYTYGKHIAARFEQLYGEEIQASRS